MPPTTAPRLTAPFLSPRLQHVWLAIMAGFLLLFATHFGEDLFGVEWCSTAYESLARHLVRGEANVDDEAINKEGFDLNGKVYMYFAPFPALLRLPLVFRENSWVHWGRLYCWLAACLQLYYFFRLCLETLQANRFLSASAKRFFAVASLVGFGLASPTLMLLGRSYIFNEAIHWGFAFLLGSIVYFRRIWFSPAPRQRDFLALSLCTSAAVLSRLTFGMSACCLLALASLFHWRRLGRSLAVVWLPLVVSFTFQGWYNYARFGSPWIFIQTTGYRMQGQARVMEKLGMSRFERIPTALVLYFLASPPRLVQEPSYLRGIRTDLDRTFYGPYQERLTSANFVHGWLLWAALLGFFWEWRAGSARRKFWLPMLCFVPEALSVLSFYFITQRYLTDLMPVFVWGFIYFLAHLREPGKKNGIFSLPRFLLAAIALSCAVNFLVAWDWMLRG